MKVNIRISNRTNIIQLFTILSYIDKLEKSKQMISNCCQIGNLLWSNWSAVSKASFAAFNNLVYEIQKQMVLVLNNMRIADQGSKKPEEKKSLNSIPKKIGRNDACPCGSGKKYKNCHGNIALG